MMRCLDGPHKIVPDLLSYLDSGILQVVYDNGVTVTANLSAADYTGDGLTLARGAYTVIG